MTALSEYVTALLEYIDLVLSDTGFAIPLGTCWKAESLWLSQTH